MTLILQSATAIAAPIFPTLDEIDPSLAMIFDASRDIAGLSSGQTVNDFTARGQGSAQMRRFNYAQTGWNFPTFSTANGRPSLRFSGGQHITNLGTGTPAMAQPLTVLAAFRVDAWDYADATYARILGGGVSNVWTLRPTNVAGRLSLSVGATTGILINSTLAAGAWGVVGLVVNGASSRVISPSGVVSAITLATANLEGIRIGGSANPAITSAGGLFGDVSAARVYTRAMSDAELLATWQAMAA